MSKIKIVEHIPWGGVFFVNDPDYDSLNAQRKFEGNTEIYRAIQAWCMENCSKQWFLTKNPVHHGQVFAKPQVQPPTQSGTYQPSDITVNGGFLLMFEDPEEATAFKLTFYGE